MAAVKEIHRIVTVLGQTALERHFCCDFWETQSGLLTKKDLAF